MKLRGGEWSKGDILTLLGLMVAVVGVVAAILTIPGMPKFFHWDSADSPKQTETPTETGAEPPPNALAPDERKSGASARQAGLSKTPVVAPPWDRVRADVLSNYKSVNVVGIYSTATPQCEKRPDGELCEQPIEITLQSGDGTQKCHVDNAVYVLAKNGWALQGVFPKQGECIKTGGKP
jgi:hypothetical protein